MRNHALLWGILLNFYALDDCFSANYATNQQIYGPVKFVCLDAPTAKPTSQPTGRPTSEGNPNSDASNGEGNTGLVVGVSVAAAAVGVLMGAIIYFFLFWENCSY